jgi:hypothetical protein
MTTTLNGRPAPEDYPRKLWAWGGLDPARGIPSLSATYIEVHHEGGGRPPQSLTEATQRVRNIYNTHRKTNGWRDIFYNRVLAPDGGLIAARDGISEWPSTRRALTVLVLGDRSRDGLFPAEAEALYRLRLETGLPLRWHRQRSKTACPGSDTILDLNDINHRAENAPVDFTAIARAMVLQAYRDAWNHDPDPQGWDYWTEQLLAGRVKPHELGAHLQAAAASKAPAPSKVLFPPFRPVLRQGAPARYAPWVSALQRFLKVEESGFGPKTHLAVRTVQAFFHLVDDGVVGPRTWKLIDELNDRAH